MTYATTISRSSTGQTCTFCGVEIVFVVEGWDEAALVCDCGEISVLH